MLPDRRQFSKTEHMIEKIRIRNFRSISDITLDACDLNILIGRNDTGKSNILRAINLFFNGQTDFRTEFNFNRDFSTHAITGQGKAPEVRVDLTFSIPNGYTSPSGARQIQYTKRWRSDGLREVDPVFVLSGNKKEKIGGRSKIRSYLKNIDFHYIPALKGKEFFSELLADIYDVLSEVSEDDLQDASEPLQTAVENVLGEVSEELAGYLKTESNPKLPTNLRSVFRLIQFESEGIDLDRRGDGIRVRHVPSLVKFLCDLKARRAGHYQSFHIWGFEEPENSVDFISAFDLREQFAEIAFKSEYQLFLATHSPIFFHLEERESVQAIYFSKLEGITRVSDNEGDIWDEMGVLRVVSPFIEKSKSRIRELTQSLDSLRERLENETINPRQKTLFCEGDSDLAVLKIVREKIDVLSDVAIVSSISSGNASASQVADNLVGWHHFQKGLEVKDRAIAVGLLDKDDAGYDANTKFNEKLEGEKTRLAKISYYEPSQSIVADAKIFGFLPNPCLEWFAPDEIWKAFFEANYLTKKSNEMIFRSLTNAKKQELIGSGINSLFTIEDDSILKFLYQPQIGRKKDFSERMVEYFSGEAQRSESFKRTFSTLGSLFKGSLV
ncbi:ATP-dependent nuclease [Oricola sp.]|uniref:ATP-dependent nuclease n=1 Tax=Oricola sp. TaxID=1979950 RepID=UPI003BAAE825